MSATRSGSIYSKVSKVRPVSISIPKTPTPISRGNIIRPTFFEPAPVLAPALAPALALASAPAQISVKTTRTTRTQFSSDTLRELCSESDNDSTSSYDSDDLKEEEEKLQEWAQQYRFMQPKYEVNIDFDEASKAWRENKRRVGESWVYKREKPAESKKPVRQEASRLVRRSARVAATRR
jgi:hypothetical protein